MKTIFAVDFGSVNTSIYKRQYGLLLKEPTMVALTETNGEVNIKEYGNVAKKMLGKTNREIQFISPVLNGVIVNMKLAESLLSHFLSKLRVKNEKFDILFTIPCGLNEEELVNFKNLGLKVGADNVYFVPAILTSLLGADVNIERASGYLSLNMGGGTINVGICSLNSVLDGVTLGFGGNKIDEAIKIYVENFLDMQVSMQACEKLKNEVGSLFIHDTTNLEISGVDLITKSPKTEVVNASQLRDTLEFYFQKIYMCIKMLLNKASPDIISDISINGIVVSGGLANIVGLENYLSKYLNLPVLIADDPLNAVVLGAGKLIADTKHLKKVLENC